MNERASDIHIEALEDSVRVRFRIDGVMQEMMRYEKELLNAIVARIKIISGMDIPEDFFLPHSRLLFGCKGIEVDNIKRRFINH